MTTAPQPPGPGLPMAEPSVKMRMIFSILTSFLDSTGKSGRLHRNDLTERCSAASSRSPKNRVGRFGVWKCAIEIGEEDESLGLHAVLVQPREAWPKLCASAADWVERNALSGFEGLDLMNDRVEVEDIDALRPLTFKDRTNLSLEEAQLPRVHRARAIDGDRNFAHPFPHD